MSWVTDVVLVCGLSEVYIDDADEPLDVPAGLEGLNRWLRRRSETQSQFVRLDRHVSKQSGHAMQSRVFGAALDREEASLLIDAFAAQPWVSPKDVLLLVSDEQDSGYTAYAIQGKGKAVALRVPGNAAQQAG